MLVSTVIVSGLGHWRIGSYDLAKQALDEGLALAKRYNMRFFIGYTHYLLAEVKFICNEADAAAHFMKSIDVLEEIKGESILPYHTRVMAAASRIKATWERHVNT
jgi:hypothetical protein